jgi:hypothetical protein
MLWQLHQSMIRSHKTGMTDRYLQNMFQVHTPSMRLQRLNLHKSFCLAHNTGTTLAQVYQSTVLRDKMCMSTWLDTTRTFLPDNHCNIYHQH